MLCAISSFIPTLTEKNAGTHLPASKTWKHVPSVKMFTYIILFFAELRLILAYKIYSPLKPVDFLHSATEKLMRDSSMGLYRMNFYEFIGNLKHELSIS